MKIKLDDRRLTAYVLGELTPRRRRAVERALDTDPAVRRVVAELSAAARRSGEALKTVPAYALRSGQREMIEAEIRGLVEISPADSSDTSPGRIFSIPSFSKHPLPIAASGFALALLAFFVLFHALSLFRVDTALILLKEETGSPAARCSHKNFRPSTGLWAVRNSGRELIDPSLVYWPGHDTEAYDRIFDNPFLETVRHPLSTFSIDVDTASYANVRRFIENGSLPPKDAGRIEEMINYFDYDYPPPAGGEPFSAAAAVADCPWNPAHRLVRIGLKGREIPAGERPPANLVFLLDVSGSMTPANKLPLVKRAMKLLVERLDGDDRVAIVVYAGSAGSVLPSTPGDEQGTILAALDKLEAGGSTAGGAGIRLAYQVAAGNFIEGGVNRVILATDGDFNVGVTSRGDLVRMIEEQAKSGVFLTVLGFGMGNIKDSTLEDLSGRGNGNYAYIDSIGEARKALVEEMGSTLVTIAKDVKIQVEFNPAQAAAYRLIGYENRMLRAEDFNDDLKDAGEIGAGHTVTALYEVIPAGSDLPLPGVDPLKYQRPAEANAAAGGGELLTLKIRYKEPEGETSRLLEFPVVDAGETLAEADPDFSFAAAVASFGMLLRGSEHRGDSTFASVLDLAEAGRGGDPRGLRADFISLVRRAAVLAD